MISMKRTETRKQFWTARRLACAASVFLALAAAPGCTSSDTAGDRANAGAGANANANAPGRPTVTVTQQRGAQPAQPAPAPNQQGFVALSEQALNADVVDVAVRRLRAKLDDPFRTRLLHTVRGMGYVLELRGAEDDE
jgi:hypothetical protein